MNISKTELSCDVLVAGGGAAGVPCALSAARNGARVILVQDRPVLGGNASSEVRMHVVGADCHGRRGKELEVETREGGIIEEIRLEVAAGNPQRCASVHDLVLFDLCRNEPNLTLLLNTVIHGVAIDGDSITKAYAARESTEEKFAISAPVFIDCTGDGRLGAEAGAAFRRGREARSEFGESLAQEQADSFSLGSSLLFTARRHDTPMPFSAPVWARRIQESDLTLRPVTSGPGQAGYEYGHWWLEWGGKLDTIRDNELIRDELLSILLGVWDYIKNSGKCEDAENWAMDWFGFVPGKRESRRFLGPLVLTQNDVEKSIPFADAIAYGGWHIDTHPPEGVDAPHLRPCSQYWLPSIYDIPLRCCLSRNIRNLMFAGRNISATHVAFASTRVMATCAAIGEGVGTAAAYAVKEGLAPADLPASTDAMSAIRQQLLKQDCYLIGVQNDDPGDLARSATAQASSSLPDAGAENIISGQTRSVHGKDGAPEDRSRPGTHRWISDPSAGLPAWVSLSWAGPVAISEIRVVFDTGMHRELTFSHSNFCHRKVVWGPQPETVRDYHIDIQEPGGDWRRVASEEGNYKRLRVHALPGPTLVSALRVTVLATNGAESARVCEVRVY